MASHPSPASLASVPLFSASPSMVAPLSLPPAEAAPSPSITSLASLLAGPPPAALPVVAKTKPLVYSPALPPVPAKAMEKIRTDVYFDLKELLPDNAALLQRLQDLGNFAAAVSHSHSSTVRLREINNPLTWVFCFLSFMAAKTDSEQTRDMIAYAQIIIQLARRHGGTGWLLYDQQFRQQAAGGAATPWREINNSLLSATVLAPQAEATGTRRLICAQCQGDDHTVAECALGGPAKDSSTKAATYQQAASLRSSSSSRKRSHSTDNICRNYNRNACFADPCRYEHSCLLCSRPGHGARDCGREPKGKGKAGASAGDPRGLTKGARDPPDS